MFAVVLLLGRPQGQRVEAFAPKKDCYRFYLLLGRPQGQQVGALLSINHENHYIFPRGYKIQEKNTVYIIPDATIWNIVVSNYNSLENFDKCIESFNKAKSDSLNMPTSSDQLDNRPEINNLITIYSSISNIEKDKIIELFANKEISSFKNELKEVVISLIEPISKEIQKIMNDQKYLQETLNDGSLKARERANKTILELNSIMGFNFD